MPFRTSINKHPKYSKCPRCHGNCMEEARASYCSYDTSCRIWTHIFVRCLVRGCGFTFAQSVNQFFLMGCIDRYFPIGSGKEEVLQFFNYNGIGSRTFKLWGSLRYIDYSDDLWRRYVWTPFKYMLYAHHKRWNDIIYKILDHPERMHPDLIKSYIIPMLDVNTELSHIMKKINRKRIEWVATAVSGGQFLFGDDAE